MIAAEKPEQLPNPDMNEKNSRKGMLIEPGPAAYATSPLARYQVEKIGAY